MSGSHFRDVCGLLAKLREFLLGRKITSNSRFPPLVSSRTIPTPEIPRGPTSAYSDRYYLKRDVLQAVKPPAVAPVAEGPPPNKDPTEKSCPGGIKPDTVCFASIPTPGPAWWWDGHSYYEEIADDCQPMPDESPTPPAKPCQ